LSSPDIKIIKRKEKHMSRIRLNNEYRQKFFNRIKHVFEEENTQEKEAYLQARENVNEAYSKVFPLAKEVVERTNLPEDVKILQGFKKKYGSPCDVVAKDKCFYFATTKEDTDEDNEEVDTDDDKKTVQSHFDFGLYGSLNGTDYSSSEDKKAFAYAYFREELKEKGLNPDIMPQMKNKDDNIVGKELYLVAVKSLKSLWVGGQLKDNWLLNINLGLIAWKHNTKKLKRV
jgi:hypothetical protein